MSASLQKTRALFAAPSTREFLWWCLPGVLVAVALRVVLTVHLPWAFYHDDAPDFLHTTERLFEEFKWELHSKKTFLVPIAFTLPFFLPVPAMLTIPLAQHALGIVIVLLIGLLCRLWSAWWRVWIVPLTVLAAVNPFFLWFEHTLMAETIFVFTTLLVALAGTLYTLAQTRTRFLFLCGALLLEAGARPEGKLLFGFGILLVVVLHWGAWRENRARLAGLVVLALATHFGTKTSQAGLLLYTSLARFTPTDLRCAPDFEKYIAPIRADFQQRWDEKPSFPRVRDRRAVAAAVKTYLDERVQPGGDASHGDVDRLSLKIATETLRRNPGAMPAHAGHKFRIVATEAPSGCFDNAAFFDKQREAITDSDRALTLSRGLFGRKMTTKDELNAFVDTHYGEVPWFNRFQNRWLATVNAWRLPDARYRNPENPKQPFLHPGVPLYFHLGGVGLIAVAFRRGRLQPLHIVWGLTLLGFFFTIMLTANVRPRFRFVFEPFWFVYIALLIETCLLGIGKVFRRA